HRDGWMGSSRYLHSDGGSSFHASGYCFSARTRGSTDVPFWEGGRLTLRVGPVRNARPHGNQQRPEMAERIGSSAIWNGIRVNLRAEHAAYLLTESPAENAAGFQCGARMGPPRGDGSGAR